jgi:hypothetical protein
MPIGVLRLCKPDHGMPGGILTGIVYMGSGNPAFSKSSLCYCVCSQ